MGNLEPRGLFIVGWFDAEPATGPNEGVLTLWQQTVSRSAPSISGAVPAHVRGSKANGETLLSESNGGQKQTRSPSVGQRT